MKKNHWFVLLWLGGLCLLTMLSPFILSEYAQRMDFSQILEAPSTRHLFGTDSLGRDVLSRILCGAAVSLGVGFGAVGLALLIGVFVGAAAGYYGGWRDRCLMSLVDMMLCFPTFFLILSVIAVLGPNIFNIMLIIGITGWMDTARLVRAEVLSLKEREFILASRALGAGDQWIIFRHLIPNAASPVIVNAILAVAAAILLESGLSFLGIGVQPPTPSWGNILLDGKANLGVAWWLTVFPGAMIFLTVLSANLLGDEMHARIKGND